MHITMETDYAIRIMILLARQQSRLDAKKISEQTQVTLRFALKILRKLAAAQLIKSYKGVGGGYEINQSPCHITLKQIIVLIEGDCYLSRCLDERRHCNRYAQQNCKMRQAFDRVSKILNMELQHITLDQLL